MIIIVSAAAFNRCMHKIIPRKEIIDKRATRIRGKLQIEHKNRKKQCRNL